MLLAIRRSNWPYVVAYYDKVSEKVNQAEMDGMSFFLLKMVGERKINCSILILKKGWFGVLLVEDSYEVIFIRQKSKTKTKTHFYFWTSFQIILILQLEGLRDQSSNFGTEIEHYFA